MKPGYRWGRLTIFVRCLAACSFLPLALRVVPAQAQDKLEVRGQVVDKKSGQPIAAITVSGFEAADGGPAITDEQGRFVKKIKPTKQVWITIHSKPYLSFGRIADVPQGATTLDLGKLELERGFQVRGSVRDAKENPVADARLEFGYKHNGVDFRYGSIVHTANDGTFVSGFLPSGPASLRFDRTYGWEMTPANSIKIEVLEEMPPLQLFAQAVQMKSATGRVVTPEGQPIPQAKVDVTVEGYINETDGTRSGTGDQHTLRTDANGYYVVPKLLATTAINVFRVTAPGREARSLGKAAQHDGEWTISDTVMAARNASIRGRVLNADGQPVAGAQVASPSSKDFAPVTTGDDGSFELQNLVEGPLEIHAAKGRDFGRLSLQKATDAEVRLYPPARITAPMRQQYFEQAAIVGQRVLAPYEKSLTPESSLFYALQSDKLLPANIARGEAPAEFDWRNANWKALGEKGTGENVRTFLENALGRPQWTAQNAAEIAALLPPDLQKQFPWFQAFSGMAQCAALFGDDKARQWAARWLEGAVQNEAAKRGQPTENLTSWCTLAGIAAALGREDAPQYLSYALALAQQRQRKIGHWEGRGLAFGGAQLFDLLEGKCTLQERAEALEGGSNATMRLRPETSQRLFEKLEALMQSAEYQELAQKSPDEARKLTVARLSGMTYSAMSLAETDPDTAYKLLEATKRRDVSIGFPEYQFTVVRGVIKAKRFDLARKIIEPYLELDFSLHAETGAKAGGLAMAFDTGLADKFFAKARPYAMQRQLETPLRNAVAFAAEYQKRDPAFARLLLEDVISRVRRGDYNKQRIAEQEQPRAAAALFDLDPVRAFEAVASLPDAGEWTARQARAAVLARFIAEEKTGQP